MYRIRSLEEWEKAKKKRGVIYNESPSKYSLNDRNFSYPMLHNSICGVIQSMHWETSKGMDKYFFDYYNEAVEWLNKNKGGVKRKDCLRCRAVLVTKDE